MKFFTVILLGLFVSAPAFGNTNNNNNNNNVIVVPQQCPAPKVKWKTQYKDRVVYKDRIVYKDKIIYKDKIVEKPVVKEVIRYVEKPVIKYVDKPRIVTRTKVKRVVRKIEPDKNAVSLFGFSGQETFSVEERGDEVRVNKEDQFGVGLMYQRDFSWSRWSLGITNPWDNVGVMGGFGVTF
jgi:hypothetical protein